MSGFAEGPANLSPDGKPAKSEQSETAQPPKTGAEPKIIVGGFGSTPRPNRRGGTGW